MNSEDGSSVVLRNVGVLTRTLNGVITQRTATLSNSGVKASKSVM